ncbi:MAG: hypothetical protein M3Z23_00405 [Acidobacteriota bacterium]|nr:hypothetical protein [Acidobacteriota bacterium]
MRNTLTIRLPDDLSEWLASTAEKLRAPRGRIIREQLEKARSSQGSSQESSFMRFAGAIDGPADLSTRKGFSKK